MAWRRVGRVERKSALFRARSAGDDALLGTLLDWFMRGAPRIAAVPAPRTALGLTQHARNPATLSAGCWPFSYGSC